MRRLDGFPLRLKAMMDRDDFTRQSLSRWININVKTVSDWLDGKAYPRAQYLAVLCDLFDVSADWLLFGRGIDEEN